MQRVGRGRDPASNIRKGDSGATLDSVRQGNSEHLLQYKGKPVKKVGVKSFILTIHQVFPLFS